MDYRRFGDVCYIRLDRGDEILESILHVCTAEGIASATYSGIGGCRDVDLAIFDPERRVFLTERIEGMLEMVSIIGNVISDGSGAYHQHAHAQFSFVDDGKHRVVGGHIKSTTVLYTAEIELRPTTGGVIGSMFNEETGTFLWSFDD